MWISDWITRRWDAVENHLGRHRRKYAALAFIVISLPKSAPTTRNAIVWLFAMVPSEFLVSIKAVDYWNWITFPVGSGLLLLILYETRKSNKQPKLTAEPNKAELPYPTVTVFMHVLAD